MWDLSFCNICARCNVYKSDIIFPDLVKLTMDDKTANKTLWVTEAGAKVARMTDTSTCPVLDRPERYEHAPQVRQVHDEYILSQNIHTKIHHR